MQATPDVFGCKSTKVRGATNVVNKFLSFKKPRITSESLSQTHHHIFNDSCVKMSDKPPKTSQVNPQDLHITLSYKIKRKKERKKATKGTSEYGNA